MLPSGGGIRVLRQFTSELKNSFDVSFHVPNGGSKLNIQNQPGLNETFYPFDAWKKPVGVLRPIAPAFLIYRLLAFKKVCKHIARQINASADHVLVHNTLPIAAPPILQYLTVPSTYFCYEHPRHLYEKDIIKRTDSMLKEMALSPLASLEKMIDLKSARSANRIITFSSYMQNNIANLYGRKASIVRPGVDSTFFHPATMPHKKRDYALSVGALWPFKGHETAVKIIAEIPPESRPKLKIVADREYPGYTAVLMKLAYEQRVDLEILQGIKDIDLRLLYQNAHAVLCCQKREPYGLVPLEAMACGTPVIALKQGGFTDSIAHMETGYLFENSTELASDYLMGIISGTINTDKTTSNALEFVRNERTLLSGAEALIMEINRE